MEAATRLKYLRIALIIFGVFLIVGLYPLMMLWPSGWRWIPNQQNYEQMIVVIYFVLGIFLVLAAKDPLENLSLIWFTVWSSIAHALVMLVQSIVYSHEHGHLMGDVPALILMAIILAILTPRRKDRRSKMSTTLN